ncbi:reverse transcriptase family protein [Ruminococcus sp. CLA-AA-H200]|uniref:RNA-directed DNA polymerase n=1 Tax=Ruminococcus turbiniformis TaxID=2881258 RepID=A0ABS8FY46_9FIRM|nr:reverse transcriptase family protein [Ruminococcus turbiniformis]MCC2253619.1 reverse transcriptase family protein [Ruminococcus turbiniformis]
MSGDLWKYSTKEHWVRFLLSLGLTEPLQLSESGALPLLYELSNHPEAHYTLHRIPKRSGGVRLLHEPDTLLKTVQRQILKNVLKPQSVSDCARAYRDGVSLKDNASAHTGKALILKLDIHDFFGSISYLNVFQHAFPGTLFPPAVRTMLTALCCCDDALPQGAPTSPYISNLVMKPFDNYTDIWCRQRGISYTRYCDDLTFSGDFDPREVQCKTEMFLLRLGFELNRKKTKVIRSSSRQEVTGLTVNEKVSVPKEYRRKLRQEWHYIEKFGLEEHLKRTAGPDTASPELTKKYLLSLSGRIGHVLQADPESAYFREMASNVKTLLQNG